MGFELFGAECSAPSSDSCSQFISSALHVVTPREERSQNPLSNDGAALKSTH